MNRIKINLQIKDNTLPIRRMEDEYAATGVTMNNRTYIEIGEYCKQYNTGSDSTVRRLLKKVEHARCNEYFIKFNGKIYVSPSITMLTNENFSKTQTIHGNWETFLRGFEWDYFGAVSFKWALQRGTAKQRMQKFFDRLSKKYKAAEIRLFFVCEENQTREGYHTHFLLWTDVADKTEIKRFTENHFRGNAREPFANTSIDRYDPNDGGIGYILKEMNKNPDGYDYLYKNKPEG